MDAYGYRVISTTQAMNTTTLVLIVIGAVLLLLILFTLFLFFRGGGQKPLRYVQRPFGTVTGWLLRLSGHHPAEFERLDASVAWRSAAWWRAVLVPPLIAFAGIWATCEAFERGGALTKALGGGLFVLLLDFILVAALSGSRSGKASWVLVGYRSAVAIGLGWFIARAPILMIYQSSIDGLNRKDRWEEIRRTTEERETLRKDSLAAQLPLAEHYEGRRKLVEDQLLTMTASKGPVNARIIELDILRQKEDLDGLDGTKPGRGDQYAKRLGYLNEEKEKLARIEKEEGRLQTELTELAKAHEEQLAKLGNDPIFKKLGDAASQQIGEAQASRPGWSEREDLLWKWVLDDPVKRLPGLAIIHALLLLLDVLPLLTMLFVPRDELEAARRARVAQAKAEADCMERMAPERADNLVRERMVRDELRERIPTLKEIADERQEFAMYQILRKEQVVAAGKPAFFKLRYGATKPPPEQAGEWEAAWEEAAEPLRQAMEKNLRDFDNLVG